MHEYILFSPTKKAQQELNHVPWMLEYLFFNESEDTYQKLLYPIWLENISLVDGLLDKTFSSRYDYRHEDKIHTLYNELTKEITIILINSYHIVLKCDKIPYVIIQTIKNYYPTLRVFRRDNGFEEVKL